MIFSILYRELEFLMGGQMTGFLKFSAEPIDLAQPLSNEMLNLLPHGKPSFTSKLHALSGTEFRIGHISTSTHTGTHIDFPIHLLPKGKTQEDFRAEDFVGEAIVIDLSDVVSSTSQGDGPEGIVEITVSHLIASGPEIMDGDIVLLHFGYSELFQTDRYRNQHPYLSEAAAEYLVSKKVKILGLDLQTPDLPASRRWDNFPFPIHHILLSANCLIIENLGPGIRKILGKRVFFAAQPLPLPGGDGSPVRPIAWIQD
jgi:arylformamidase